METNVILAGVGGQGILTIAQAVSVACVERGWQIKQAEVHGMSQRGGAVQSHLRIADHPIYSDLIPLGTADLILSVEPLEALRYVEYLSENGAIVANTTPFVNIPNYPPVESVLERIARFSRHVLIDADRLARAAGSARSVNAVLLGAGSLFLGIEPEALETGLNRLFARKGDAVVRVNLRAFQLGRKSALLYREGLSRGGSPRTVREWLDGLSVDQITGMDVTDADLLTFTDGLSLSSPETEAVRRVLASAQEEGRQQLYEHEVYSLIELVGAISSPRHVFVPYGQRLEEAQLDAFPGDKVVLKLVSEQIVHKSDAGAVLFVPKQIDVLNQEIGRLCDRQRQGGTRVTGVLAVEFVEHGGADFGRELFVGIRASREFGAVIAAGLGGIDTEYLARNMKPGMAVAKALVRETTPDDFFQQFQRTAAYEILSGKARGHRRSVSDGELLRCFRAFLAIAHRFCFHNESGGPYLREVEVNPFAFVQQRMVPLDGRGSLGEPSRASAPRPLSKVKRLLEPKSIAIVGVSAKRENFGRIILDNTLECGFPKDRLFVVKPGVADIDGVRCVPSITELPERVDLVVVASGSAGLSQLIGEVIDGRKAESVILIPGALGETSASIPLEADLRQRIQSTRSDPDGGLIVLGGNCLGIRSRPGRYDTFFIPRDKMDPTSDAPVSRAALVTQSGAFAITRISNLEALNVRLAVTIGNQIDLTVSDVLRAVGDRDDIDAIGVYIEGFRELDGLSFIRAVEDVTNAGKTVILYKAGKTEAGRSATAGHTASVAGDHEVCQAAAAAAGAIVVDTFKEFEQVLELATLFHAKTVGGRRIGVISNAGFEAVGMADAIQGARYELQLPALSEPTCQQLRGVLELGGLAALVDPKNPLDLNPMADEDVYENCARAFLDEPLVDAVVVSIVPFTPRLRTTPSDLRNGSPPSAQTLPERFRRLIAEYDKPVIAVIDAGPPYHVFARELRHAGVPVFLSCDQAIRSLGRYLCHRAARTTACVPPRNRERVMTAV